MLASFVRPSTAVAQAELHKLFRDPTEVLSRSMQPVLWLVVFGQVFGRLRAIPTGGIGYLDFMAPGILAQSVLFSAIFYGIAVIWERDLGIVHKMLVSPADRAALVVGKATAAGMRGLVQAVIVYAVAWLLHIRLRLGAPAVVGVLCAVVLGSAIFSTFSLVVACVVKTRERFMGIGQGLTMPLFFASNALYPIDLMPGWLKIVALANPLSYLVDILRAQMIVGAGSVHGPLLDLGVLGAAFLLLLGIAARLYPALAQ